MMDIDSKQPYSIAAMAALREAIAADRKWPKYNSAHEGFAVLWEEVEELWEIVKTKQPSRDLEHMRTEAIQIAAVAIRFAADVCNEERGRK
jgi:hypothetical protein